MSESVLDFASLDTAAAEVDAPVVDTTTTTDAPVVDTTTTDKADAPVVDSTKKEAKPQYNSDGSPKTDDTAKAEDLPGSEKTPQEIRKALKAFRDIDPVANGNAVKQLHGAFERWEAAKAIYPGGVKEMQQAKEFAELVGGAEGYEKLTGTVQAAEASDAKLYEGNPELIQNIVDDLKAQGKLDALGKLAPSFLDAVKAHDEKGYYSAFAPHFLSGLETVNMPGAINGLVKALADPDPAKAVAAAKEIADGLSGWYKNLETENKKSKDAVISPERKQLEADRAAFLKQQEDFKTNQSTEFKNNVAKTCESVNNKTLGSHLGAYLKMPFFKGFGRENLMPLGNTIKQNLYDTLKADGAYQAQMKAMWGAKTPDRAKIEEYHKARVDSISEEIVRNTVQKMYPGYAKGGAAAGRVAAATEKKTVAGKTDAAAATATAAGKPTYVAQKPAWDSIDWDKDPKQLMYITGKAYLKGKGTLVTWRK
jgi:hypothetical protein